MALPCSACHAEPLANMPSPAKTRHGVFGAHAINLVDTCSSKLCEQRVSTTQSLSTSSEVGQLVTACAPALCAALSQVCPACTTLPTFALLPVEVAALSHPALHRSPRLHCPALPTLPCCLGRWRRGRRRGRRCRRVSRCSHRRSSSSRRPGWRQCSGCFHSRLGRAAAAAGSCGQCCGQQCVLVESAEASLGCAAEG